MEKSDRRILAERGENLAADYLVELGFTIVARNVRYKTGEIDIVARRGGDLHFIEVKTRSDSRFVPPLEAVTRFKMRRIRLTAMAYLADSRNGFRDGKLPVCRFDVIAIDYAKGKPSIECVFDAFE